MLKKSSGEHPVVVDYRKKIQSLNDNDLPRVEALNDDLKAYLEEIRTPTPPAPDFDPEATTLPGT